MTFFKMDSIKKNLLLVVIILLVLIGLQLLVFSRILDREYQLMQEINYEREQFHELTGAEYAHLSWQIKIEKAFVTGEIPDVEDYTECDLGKWIYSRESTRGERRGMERLKEIHINLHQAAENSIALLSGGERGQALDLFLQEVEPASAEMEAIMSEMHTRSEQRVQQLESSLEDVHDLEKLILLGFAGLITLGAMFMAYYLNSSIVKPIVRIARGMENIEKGDLETGLSLDSNNEIGYLADNFNRMLEPLRLKQISAEILEIFASGYDRRYILAELAAELDKISDVISVAIYTYDEWENKLQLAEGNSLPAEIKDSYQLGEGLIGEVAKSNRIKVVNNPDSSWDLQTGITDISLKSITGFPVFYKEKLLAVMMVGSCQELNDSKCQQLKYTASQLGITLNNIRQYNSIQQLVNKLESKNEELNEQKNYAEAVLQSSADGIFSVDNNRRIQTWSRGAEEITGFKAEEVQGRVACDVVKLFNEADEYLCQGDRCYIEEVLAGNKTVSSLEIRVKTKQGPKIPCRFSIGPIHDHKGQLNGSVQVFRDISREKENLLKIKQANKVKSEFLATMSHELRTPLNSIIGFSELLENEVAGPLVEKQHHYLENIIDSSRHLLSLINDILDISKIESGEMSWQTGSFNLKQLLENSLLMSRGLARKKEIKLDSEIVEQGLESVEGDERKIKQIIYNLLQNAIKFTPEGGKVALKARREEDFVIIEVQDTGIGIPAAKQETIFEPFVQLDSDLSRKYEGTGLGLDLVKRMTELGGGKVEVESEPGAGSTFIVRLPLKEEIREKGIITEEAGIVEIEKDVEDEKKDKVFPDNSKQALIIEDDPGSAQLIAEYLQKMGYSTLTAENARQGLEIALKKGEALELITLDIMLPEYEGWDVLRDLKQNQQTVDIPVVIISVLSEEKKGLALGAFDYLTKPLDQKKLQLVARKLKQKSVIADRGSLLLAIDDEPRALEIIDETLSAEDFTVKKAYGGKEGLKKAGKIKPDAILLDLMMPEMDGFEVIEKLKDDPELSKIPVIIVTAKVLTKRDKEKLNKQVYFIANKSEMKLEKFKEELEKAVSLQERG